MSRIEEALKRARVPHHEHVETPVVSAWHFDRLPSEPGEDAEDDAPVSPAADVSPVAESSATGPVQVSPTVDAAPAKEPAPSHVRWNRSFSNAVAEKLVVMPETNQLSVEQYRKVAATLHQIQIERGVKVVMVASALPGEGKTLTSANLALTLSESYRRRVLLIDADLRRPQLHEVFQVPNASGLNEGLKSPADQRLSVIEMSPRLVLLPGGRPDPDPMSILTSDRMRRVVTEAAASFDWVILDAPPIVPLPDTNLLAAMVDIAVLVIAAGQTPHNMITRAVEILGRDRIAGVVLNRVDDAVVAANAGGKGGHYYGGYGESAITKQS